MAIFLNAPIPELKDLIVLGGYLAVGDRIILIHSLGGMQKRKDMCSEWTDKGFGDLYDKFDKEVDVYYHSYEDDFFMGEYCGDGNGEPYDIPCNVDDSYEECSKSDNATLRTLVAENGECLDVLLKDPDGRVRAAAAGSSSLEVRKTLINDSDWRVRKSIVAGGDDELLAMLADDENIEVLIEVIIYSDPKATVRYTTHESEEIRCALVSKFNDTELVELGLMSDKSDKVRATIAGSWKGWDYLKDDPSPLVQEVLKQCEDDDIPW